VVPVPTREASLRLVDPAAGQAFQFIQVGWYKLQVGHAPLGTAGTTEAFFHQGSFGGLMTALPVALQGISTPELLIARRAFHGVLTSVSQATPYITQQCENIKLFLKSVNMRSLA
jgi:hypothetical protein